MENKKERFEELKEIVYKQIMEATNDQQKNALIHLSGVASFCGLLALKRSLSIDICMSAGILHDLWLFLNFPLTLTAHKTHGIEGSQLIKDMLIKTALYSSDEINLICDMVYFHNNKDEIGNEYEELIKDADALQHFINNSGYDKSYDYSGRIEKVLKELNINYS